MNLSQRENLIKLRKKINLTQSDIASKLGITTSYYGMIEQGTRTPSLTLAKKISNFFNKDIEGIFFDNKYNKTLCEDNQKQVV